MQVAKSPLLSDDKYPFKPFIYEDKNHQK